MDLTTNQRAAIEHRGGNLQLIACAGSGKTEVVAQRVVHLLTPGRVDSLEPRNIVAFTFTDKAAAELKQRIVERTEEALGPVTGLAEMFVGTIHGFCLDVIKSEVPKYLKYEVLNEVQEKLFVDRNSKKSGLTTSTTLDGQVLRRYTDTKNYISALSLLREDDVDSDKLHDISVSHALPQYQSLLDDHRYLDYSSILGAADIALRESEEVRRSLAERVKYVIVDEYQDVNPIQERIVDTLCKLGSEVCVVGDDDQTIYQWRGSDVGNILTFKDRYRDVSQVPLAENFRSTRGIVETARGFIEQNDERLPKNMTAEGDQEYEVGDIVALHFQDPHAEAQHIVATVQDLRGVAFSDEGKTRGLSWSDMAILLRSVKSSGGPITKALEAAGIPFVVQGMTTLFDTAEADAARHMFYFMASQQEATIEVVRQAWQRADLGIEPSVLETALANLVDAKEALTGGDQQRWGQYSIQRVFLAFLQDADLREETVPGGVQRAETVLYNLGKFSQLISDFEEINFQSEPKTKYESFAGFLKYRASDYYSEGWQENEYITPDAVQVMTVHQAKGMQWPVVFLPALLRNKFPMKKPGGRTIWHLLPKDCLEKQSRYEGSVEDERRLFYVAMTRSQKFLHATWAPVPNNQLFQKKSEFWENILVSKYVKRSAPDYSSRDRGEPKAKRSVSDVTFSFSDLKYFLECPYQFKLRILYGFNAPIHEALGYGKSLHDALAEVHARALGGDIPLATEASALTQEHLHVPFAYPALEAKLRKSAERAIAQYLDDNSVDLNNVEFSEKTISVNLGDGVSVVGRVDLIRRLDNDETTIVDLKSSDRAQAEEVTETQLHTYALGYQELTGRDADFVEIYELDEGRRKPRSVDETLLDDVKREVSSAAEALRTNAFPPKPSATKCGQCDYRGMCSAAV